MTDILETARWVAEGRLAPWAVSDESVVEMARKLLEAIHLAECMADALAEAGLDKMHAVEAEREACARVADEAEAGFSAQTKQCDNAWDEAGSGMMANAAFHIAKAIRARGGR